MGWRSVFLGWSGKTDTGSCRRCGIRFVPSFQFSVTCQSLFSHEWTATSCTNIVIPRNTVPLSLFEGLYIASHGYCNNQVPHEPASDPFEVFGLVKLSNEPLDYFCGTSFWCLAVVGLPSTIRATFSHHPWAPHMSPTIRLESLATIA